MFHRCSLEDDLLMLYQKMSCRCLIEDDLQMPYEKMLCMRCLKDVLYDLTAFYIIYLQSIFNMVSYILNLMWQYPLRLI